MNWVDIGRTAVEVLVIGAIVYAFIRFLQQTRGNSVLKGFILVVAICTIGFMTLVQGMGLERLKWISDRALLPLLFGIGVVFQPELRQALVSLGESTRGLSRRRRHGATEELVQAAERLARKGLGALILIERQDGISGFADDAVTVDAVVTVPLILTVFSKDAPLHDGAMIIRRDRIVAAGCVLPLSENPNLSQALGTRHRAALGVTEECDALAIVVSEETQRISVAQRGQLEIGVTLERLRDVLMLPAPTETPVPVTEPAP